LTVGFKKFYENPFLPGRWQILANKISPDWQFPMPTVYKYGKFYRAWSAQVIECVQRGPDRSATKENVIN
jgi:hypothetical protein